MRPPCLRLSSGIFVAAALIATDTLVVYPLAVGEHRAARP
jgi:hypothetical protein